MQFFQSNQHLYEKREGFGSGSVPLTNGPGSGRPKKHTDPAEPDPDPQHCFLQPRQGQLQEEISADLVGFGGDASPEVPRHMVQQGEEQHRLHTVHIREYITGR
jgi:hypothetical protein